MAFKHSADVLGDFLKNKGLTVAAKKADQKHATLPNSDPNPNKTTLIEDPLLHVVMEGLTFWKNCGLRFVPADIPSASVAITQAMRLKLKVDEIHFLAMRKTFEEIASKCREHQPPVDIVDYYRNKKESMESAERIRNQHSLPPPVISEAQKAAIRRGLLASFIRDNYSTLTALERVQLANNISEAVKKAKEGDKTQLLALKETYPDIFDFLKSLKESKPC